MAAVSPAGNAFEGRDVASPPPRALPRSALSPVQLRRRHWDMLLIAVATIILAFCLRIVQGDRVAWWFLPRWPLPHTCMPRAWFGVECPGCGLTRSFILLAQGQWTEAWHQHHLGWLFALATVLQIPYRLCCLRYGWVLPRLAAKTVSHGLIALLIINWLLGLVIH
jgi:hypothetical protein